LALIETIFCEMGFYESPSIPRADFDNLFRARLGESLPPPASLFFFGPKILMGQGTEFPRPQTMSSAYLLQLSFTAWFAGKRGEFFFFGTYPIGRIPTIRPSSPI